MGNCQLKVCPNDRLLILRYDIDGAVQMDFASTLHMNIGTRKGDSILGHVPSEALRVAELVAVLSGGYSGESCTQSDAKGRWQVPAQGLLEELSENGR